MPDETDAELAAKQPSQNGHSEAAPLSEAELVAQRDLYAPKVIAVIAKAQRIPAETITLDSTFEELKIDSLDGINIVFALENEFGIDIPDEGAQNLRSVRETVDGVAKLVAAKADSPTIADREKTA